VVKSKRIRWTGHIARMGEMKNRYKNVVGKFEWERPLAIRRCRWEDNIKIDLRETVC
jgi:hypothetical protein